MKQSANDPEKNRSRNADIVAEDNLRENNVAGNNTARRLAMRRAVALCLAVVFCSVAITARSYRYSDSLSFLDVTLCTDEGLLSLQIPLVRKAANEPSAPAQWITYRRGQTFWEVEGGGKMFLRTVMSMLDQMRADGWMVAGFGYWKGSWQSASRPGPFVVLFMPIWAAIVGLFSLVAIVYWRRIQFRLATIMIFTACVGAALWLLTW